MSVDFKSLQQWQSLAASFNAAYILMHAQGSPQDMQDNPNYVHVTQIS